MSERLLLRMYTLPVRKDSNRIFHVSFEGFVGFDDQHAEGVGRWFNSEQDGVEFRRLIYCILLYDGITPNDPYLLQLGARLREKYSVLAGFNFKPASDFNPNRQRGTNINANTRIYELLRLFLCCDVMTLVAISSLGNLDIRLVILVYLYPRP